MGPWVKANGGPLALVVVGLGLAGFKTPLAYTLVAVGVVWWVGERYVLPHIPWRLHREGGIKSNFEFDGHYLVVGIVNEKATMRDAGINVLVPARCKRIMRMVTAGEIAPGDCSDTSESLESDGGPSIYWNEKKLHILGGGNSTLYYFRVSGGGSGEYPVRLKLYDDADTPRRAVIDGTFTIPPRPIDQARRATTLASTLNILEQNRRPLVQALGRGHYWPSGETWLKQPDVATIRHHLDPGGADAKLVPLISEALEETARIAELVVDRGGDEPEVKDTDRVERALTSISFAQVYGKQALEEVSR